MSFALEDVLQCLQASDCFEVQDVKELAMKDSSVDSSGFIDIILSYVTRAADDDRETSVSCLKEVVASNRDRLKHDQMKNMYDVAARSHSTIVRGALFALITEFFTQEDIEQGVGLDEFNKIVPIEELTVESQSDLSIFRTLAERGSILPENMIMTLASSLANPDLAECYQMIVEILQVIKRHQTLGSECVDIMWSAIDANEDLLNSASLVSMLVEYSMEITDKMLKKLWELFAGDHFEKEDKSLVASLLLREYKRAATFLDVYNGEQNSATETLCQQISIKLREDTIENNDLNEDTLIDYFNAVIKVLQNDLNTEKLSNLSNYMHNDDIPTEEKYTFLKLLHSCVNDSQGLDLGTCLDYPECDWLKEMLCTLLLRKSLHCSKISIDDIEGEVNMFAANTLALEETSTTPTQDLEDVLSFQIKHKTDIREVNDILTILWDVESGAGILKSDSDDTLYELNTSFLTNKLQQQEIIFSSEEIVTVQDLMASYRPHVLSNVFDNISFRCNIGHIIEFFQVLNESCLNAQESYNFLLDSENNLSGSPVDWVATLHTHIVCDFLNRNENLTSLVENKAVIEKCSQLLQLGWKIQSINKLCNSITERSTHTDVVEALEVIIEFKLKEYDSNVQGTILLDLFANLSTSTGSLKEKVHEVAVFQRFDYKLAKDVTQLRKEIMEELNNKESATPLLTKPCKDDFDTVMATYEGTSVVLPELGPIVNWERADIMEWSNKVREGPSRVTMLEKVAVVRRALYLFVGEKYFPREVQLMSALILLNPQEQQGRLAQINTGEGKTMIVSMLAVVKALDGHQVDVVTSSSELARPQCDEQRPFFEMFGLTAAHNGVDSTKIERRYLADVVYGAAGDFQGDILRDEYSLLGTRSGRKCDIAIVDEVDSMLIDGRNHMVMLSSPMPAMDHLEPVLAAIWMQVGFVASCLQEHNGVTYYCDYQDRFKSDGTVDTDKEEELKPIKETKSEFIKKCVLSYVRQILRDKEHLTSEEVSEITRMGDKFPQLNIPKHLWYLVTGAQVERWIDSAIYAKYKCDEGKHYILFQGNVSPVDAVNTGVVHQNMHWNNGLHQFLQIKHGARVSAESFTTNFLSNVSYFRRYGSNVYGLTGTLGSVYAKQLLNETYRVDNVVIAPFKHKQYQELTPLLAYTKPDWYKNILDSTISKLELGRAVLIITKYIAEVNDLEKLLIDKSYDKSKVKVYRTAEDSTAIKGKQGSGEIIIATNIAGRGTDIKVTEEVEKNGGLHVCVTFLPPNERVEHQNVGRTSRTGNRGTGQFVILAKPGTNMETLKLQRDLKEEKALESARIEICKIVTKDKLFQRFCELLSKLFDKNPIKSKPYKKIQKIRKRSLEDRFGIWLKIHENVFEGKDENICLQMYDDFETEVLRDNANGNLIANPFFHVLCGNEYIKENLSELAIQEFNKAIEMDEHFAAHAYYGRGYARIAKYGRNGRNHDTHINDAVQDLKKAKDIIEHHLEPLLQIIQKASDSESLSEQVNHKITLYGVQKSTIDTAIGIGVGKTDEEIKELEKRRDNKTEAEIKTLNEQIKLLNDCDKDERERGIIGKAKDKGRGVEIEFIPMKDVFPEEEDINLYQAEIIEYENNGFVGNFKVTEIVPIDWWSVIGLLIIGLVQMIAGAALMLLSCGFLSSVGSSLISEGASDMVTAIKDGIINRTFDWEQWGIQKAVSLVVGLLCAGFSALKSMVKTAVTGVTSALKAGGHTLKSVCLNIGKEVAKAGAEALVEGLVDLGLDRAIMPSIRQSLTDSIEPKIQEALQDNPYVRTFLKIDGENRNRKFEKLLTERISKLIQDDVREEGGAFNQFLSGVKDGLKKKSEQGLYGKIKKGLNLTLEGAKLITFVDTFKIKMSNEIEKIAKEFKIDITSDTLEEETDKEKSAETTSVEEGKMDTLLAREAQDDDDEDIDLNKPEAEQVELEYISKTPNDLAETVSKKVVGKMCSILEGKFIKPALTTTANYGVKTIGNYGLNSIQEYQANRKFSRDKTDELETIDKTYRRQDARIKDPTTGEILKEKIKQKYYKQLRNPQKNYERKDALVKDEPSSLTGKLKEKIKEKYNEDLGKSVDAIAFDAFGPWSGAALGVIGGATLAYKAIRKGSKHTGEPASTEGES